MIYIFSRSLRVCNSFLCSECTNQISAQHVALSTYTHHSDVAKPVYIYIYTLFILKEIVGSCENYLLPKTINDYGLIQVHVRTGNMSAVLCFKHI